jgi:hypothetical protein
VAPGGAARSRGRDGEEPPTALVGEPHARRVAQPAEDLVAGAAVDVERVARRGGVAVGRDEHLGRARGGGALVFLSSSGCPPTGATQRLSHLELHCVTARLRVDCGAPHEGGNRGVLSPLCILHGSP